MSSGTILGIGVIALALLLFLWGMFAGWFGSKKAREPAPFGPKDARAEPRFWKYVGNESPLSQFVPFSSLISPNDVKMRNGDLLRIWRLGGVSFETNDEQWILERHEAFSAMLRNISGGDFAVWVHRVHRVIEDELEAPTAPPAAVAFHNAYAAKLKGSRFMANELYLSILYRANGSGLVRAMGTSQRTRENTATQLADQLRTFNEKALMVSRVLREFDPHILGDYEVDGRRYSEVMEFLGFLVNGRWKRTRAVAGPLYTLLPACRMFAGQEKLEFRDDGPPRFAALVDIKDYSATVEPGITNALLYEDTEYIETQSFSILPLKQSLDKLELQRKQLIASEDVVATQIEAMDVALNNVGDGQYSMGEYHYSLAVFGSDVRDAGRRAAECIGAMSETAGIQMVPVDLISDAAWFAQLPGNFAWRPRSAKISSRAFAALAAQHNFSTGKRDGNPWGPAAMMLRTPAGQPYYFNFHVSPDKQDSESQKLPGNMVILGTTGSGKTTLEMAILYQTFRFNPAPALVVFDFDRGAEIALRALGGKYYSLEAGKPTGCNPFKREPTPLRVQFWEKLVTQCITSASMPLMPSDEAAIAAAVRTVARFPQAVRSMSAVRENLPKGDGNSLFHRLSRWCRGGALGWVFDEADDMLLNIKQESVVGFDYTQFIDNPEVRAPMLMYLMDVMSEFTDGRRIIIMFAEFWKALSDDYVSEYIKQELKTIRKKNGLIIGETQSPGDVLKVEIGRTVVEQSVTKIFMQNPEAVRDEYVNGFGLSNAEYEIVKRLGASGRREFLVKQGHRSAICELDLGGMDDVLVLLSGATDNVRLLDVIRAEVGDDPNVWIPVLLQRARDRDARSRRPRVRAINR